MTTQPNKPAGTLKTQEQDQPTEDLQAVNNQGEAKPDDYPKADRDIADPGKR